MHAISLREPADDKDSHNDAVWRAVVDSPEAGSNPFAIPILGRGLTIGERRTFNGTITYGERACEQLQKQTKKDFGYSRTGTAEERAAAVKKAQAWWADEGKAKYTFDYIEKNLIPAKEPKK